MDDASEWREISDERRKARKEHKCFCGGTIQPGMTYRRIAGLEDGEFRVHVECKIERPSDCWVLLEPDLF